MVLVDGYEYLTEEEKRLRQDRKREKYWKKWGPYVSERQWATGRFPCSMQHVELRAAEAAGRAASWLAGLHAGAQTGRPLANRLQCARTTVLMAMRGAVSIFLFSFCSLSLAAFPFHCSDCQTSPMSMLGRAHIAGARTASPACATATASRTLPLHSGTRRSKLCPLHLLSRPPRLTPSPFLKERLFGLSNPQGNHGESIKEAHFHLDNTPVCLFCPCLSMSVSLFLLLTL